MPFAEASIIRRSIRESLSDDRLSEADAEIIANSCSDIALRRKAVGFGEKCLIVYSDSSHGAQYQHAKVFLEHVKLFFSE